MESLQTSLPLIVMQQEKVDANSKSQDLQLENEIIIQINQNEMRLTFIHIYPSTFDESQR